MTDTQPSTQYSNLPDASLLSWRFTLARRMFQVISIISLPAFLASAYYAFDEGTYVYVPIYIGILVFMLVIGFWKRVSDSVRIFGLMALIYFIVLLDFYTEGRGSLARSFLVVFSFLGAVFFGRRGAILTAVFGLLTMIFFAYLYTTNALPDYQVSSTIVSGWISNTVIVAVLMTLVIFSVDYLVREMMAFLTRSQQLNQVIEAERATLEQRVYDRTAAAESARAAAEISAKEAEAARKNIETQVWLANGQTQLADAMRGEQTLSQLAENVISQICQYTGAQAGALFLLKEKTLMLAGRYAFAERPDFSDTFQLGEGLVGQAAADGKLMVLEDIPSDTLVISTGLADMKPRQLAAAPFYMNGKVVGVIELASLSAFTQIHLELWNRISESIGSAFNIVQTRQRLAELLMESQAQAEELQAQEEELRAANEELQAQSENLKAARAIKARKDEE